MIHVGDRVVLAYATPEEDHTEELGTVRARVGANYVVDVDNGDTVAVPWQQIYSLEDNR